MSRFELNHRTGTPTPSCPMKWVQTAGEWDSDGNEVSITSEFQSHWWMLVKHVFRRNEWVCQTCGQRRIADSAAKV